MNREPMEFPEYRSYPSIFTQICYNPSCTILDRLVICATKTEPIQETAEESEMISGMTVSLKLVQGTEV